MCKSNQYFLLSGMEIGIIILGTNKSFVIGGTTLEGPTFDSDICTQMFGEGLNIVQSKSSADISYRE